MLSLLLAVTLPISLRFEATHERLAAKGAKIEIEIPAANGYVLHSRRSGTSLGIVDLAYLRERIAHLAQANQPVAAATHDVLFYEMSDATVCCSTGTRPGNDCVAIKSDFDPGVLPRPRTTVTAHGPTVALRGHQLIGYWEGYPNAKPRMSLREIAPQWDIIIATFAAPAKGSTSLLHFAPPPGYTEEQFKSDVAYLKSRGKKVLISLGGGGQVVTLNTSADVQNFTSSVAAIVQRYGFDGIDLDIETPSLLIRPGDNDFRHPTTPSIVNLIAAVRELRDHFGPGFMISEVPEAAQAQAGMQTYGGQFGAFLPVIYGTRDILSFVDAQDYNTPPLQGLDGNYYFPGTADYHVALSEMLVHGFPIGAGASFPAFPPEKVAIGLPATPSSARNYTDPADIENALAYLTTGKPYPSATYHLLNPRGYAAFKGAMFWSINQDQENGRRMSNAIGSLLHGR